MAKVLVGPFGRIEEMELPNELCGVSKSLSLYEQIVAIRNDGKESIFGIITTLQEVLELIDTTHSRAKYNVVGYRVKIANRDGWYFVKLTKPHHFLLPK